MRELELIALRLFTKRGFDATTVDEIAAAAGVSRRTFFRYFDSKAEVLWNDFDLEVDNLRDVLSRAGPGATVMDAVRVAVLSVNHYSAADVPELRARMSLINSVPELAASAALHYDAWERAIIDFVASKCGQPADTLYPIAVGRATLATCRAAYERWAARADADLTVYLDAALRALAEGFADRSLASEPTSGPRRSPRRQRASAGRGA